jgi:hypothetical protein
LQTKAVNVFVEWFTANELSQYQTMRSERVFGQHMTLAKLFRAFVALVRLDTRCLQAFFTFLVFWSLVSGHLKAIVSVGKYLFEGIKNIEGVYRHCALRGASTNHISSNKANTHCKHSGF